MNEATIQKLCDITSDFYTQNAASFSGTRNNSWPGWDRCLNSFIRGSILDLACGNMRFERYAAQHAERDAKANGQSLSFMAIDNCASLTPETLPENTAFSKLDIMKACRDASLEANVASQTKDWAGKADCAVSFGFMHHIPSRELRISFLEQALCCVRPNGYLAVSLWQFANSEQLAEKALVTHACGLSDTGLEDLLNSTGDSLEEGDFLLGWNNAPGAYRYCHNFSESEARELAEAIAQHAELVDEFEADGRTGNLNRYLVFRKRKGTLPFPPSILDYAMQKVIEASRADDTLDDHKIDLMLRGVSKEFHLSRRIAKKHLMPFFLEVRDDNALRWKRWGLSPEEAARLAALLQLKPRRTASGVATITVLTKPWSCRGRCIFCPNDVRMPKSYLADEPACQRAERCYFDPYLQVAARLNTLIQMGHVTDKVELIILGGTWCDYPESYQLWFAEQLFAALNDSDEQREKTQSQRRAFYEGIGLLHTRDELKDQAAHLQSLVTLGEKTYNQAFAELYGNNPAWKRVEEIQRVAETHDESLKALAAQQLVNETAAHRCVGLVMETRPDTVSPAALSLLRRIGCTKVQMGVQSLNEQVLACNNRDTSPTTVARAFELVRLFGFKIHAHFMANLLGASPEGDKQDYLQLVEGPAFQPDEIKLYPCALVDGTELANQYRAGQWRPYSEAELIDVLSHDVARTPAYCRISRMIRDISAHDIMVGNKKVNLRQLVDEKLAQDKTPVLEIRSREIATGTIDPALISLDVVEYETSVSTERFYQWVTKEGSIAGFLRLSLPHWETGSANTQENLPVFPGEAMIREVHVYGRVAAIHETSGGAQHLGLGRQLIERAAEDARAAGYSKLNVISAVGTRAYYRNLGFADNGLYQQRSIG